MQRKSQYVLTSVVEEAVAVKTEPEPEKIVESPKQKLIPTTVKYDPKKEGLELRHPAFKNSDSTQNQPSMQR